MFPMSETLIGAGVAAEARNGLRSKFQRAVESVQNSANLSTFCGRHAHYM
jgi:hypothetical protein